MPKALKLKAALDRQKGVNYKLEKQKKLQKEAEKRKRQKKTPGVDVGNLEAVAGAEEDEAARKATKPHKEKKAAKAAARKAQLDGEVDGWETDESEDAEDGENEEGEVVIGPMSDESDSDSEDDINGDAQNNDGDEDGDEDDIPLSDIESLASEDRADVILHQRLTINNTAALTRALKSIALPSNLPWSAVQSITTAEPVEIKDVDDDLTRELALYRQSLEAVPIARAELKKEGKPFSRPTDFFAEMVKSEEQMGKVRSKQLDDAARKKASQDARRQRDLKRFGKAVQVAKLQERQKEKRETLDRIQTLKRKRQGGNDLTTNETDMFDVALEDAAVTAQKDRAERRSKGDRDAPNRKRQKKDEKFGFGGKKRFAKSNDAKSSADSTGYSVRRMKGGKPGKQRPGKSKRAKAW